MEELLNDFLASLLFVLKLVIFAGIPGALLVWAMCGIFRLKENEGVIITRFGQARKPRICKTGFRQAHRWQMVRDRRVGFWAWLRGLFGGLRWGGFPGVNGFFEKDFEWTEYNEAGEVEHHPKKTISRFGLDRFSYAIEIKKAESKEGTKMSGIFAFMGVATNLYIQWIKNKNWFAGITAELNRAVTGVFQKFGTKKILENQAKLGPWLYRQMAASGAIAQIQAKYGVKISSFKFLNISNDTPGAEASVNLAFKTQQKVKQIEDLLEGILRAIAKTMPGDFDANLEAVKTEYTADPEKFREKHASLFDVAEVGARVALGEEAVRTEGQGGGGGLAAHAVITTRSAAGKKKKRAAGGGGGAPGSGTP